MNYLCWDIDGTLLRSAWAEGAAEALTQIKARAGDSGDSQA